MINAKEGELGSAFYSFAYFFCLLSGYYILRPLRDEMGIRGGVQNLQWLFTGTFLAVLCASPIYAAIVARLPHRKFLPLVYRFFNLNLLIFWILFQFGWNTWTARVFFIWTSVFNLFVVSVFWSFMVDVFKKEPASRLFGFIAAGGTAGALVGPLLTMGLTGALGTTHLLLPAMVLLEIAVLCIRRIIGISKSGSSVQEMAEGDASSIGGTAFSGIQIIFRSKYLVAICLYMLLMTAGSTFLYFAQAQIVSSEVSSSSTRTAIFASMDFGTNLLTLFIQTWFTGRFITGLGLPVALSILPAVCLMSFVSLSLAPVLIVLISLQILNRALRYSITHPAREILFTVLGREEKYKSKNFIDTVVYRLGDSVSAWIFHAIRAAGASLPTLMLIGAPLSILGLAVGFFLGKKHRSLR